MCSGTFIPSCRTDMNHCLTSSSGVSRTLFFRSGSQTMSL